MHPYGPCNGKPQNRCQVRNEMSAEQDNELARLEAEYRRLQGQLTEQASELSLLRARFARYESALRGSQVTVYTQDRDLRYTSISNSMLGRSIEDILGHTDIELLPHDTAAAMTAVKSDVLSSGVAKRAEVPLEDAPGIRWHDLHIEPLLNDAGEVIGLACASVDVTERKEGEAHLRLLLRELTHRSKNLLAVIQAMARQTAHHAGSIDGFLSQFGAKIDTEDLASLTRIDDQPGELHLGLVVVHPQLAVADQLLVAVEPERLHPVLVRPGFDLPGRHRRGRQAAPHQHFLGGACPAADQDGQASGEGPHAQGHDGRA